MLQAMYSLEIDQLLKDGVQILFLFLVTAYVQCLE